MNQYFDNNRDLTPHIRELTLNYKTRELIFMTDSGVFSNREIDTGSLVLLNEVTKQDLTGPILDVGCGYGAIGITLAALYPKVDVTMFDINERAVELTKINIAKNNITNGTALVSSNYQALTNKKFKLIVINPPIRAGKKVYYPLLSDAKHYLTDGGTLMFVIRKSHGAKSAEKYVLENYGNCTLLKKDRGFYVYYAISKLTYEKRGHL